MTTKERTLSFIAYKGLSVKKFEEICGLSNGYVNSMKSGFGNAKLSQVLYAFPEINRDWLVYGEGSMVKEEPQSAPAEDALPIVDESLIAELRAQICRLETKVDQLNQELGKKNAILEMLNERVKSV